MNIRLNIVVVTEIKNSLVIVTHNTMHSMKICLLVALHVPTLFLGHPEAYIKADISY
jgi:hypothetical protein